MWIKDSCLRKQAELLPPPKIYTTTLAWQRLIPVSIGDGTS